MRPINLYNTLTRTIESLDPMDGECLRFYCCGPTVYGRAHVGNFRTFVMQDVFRRVVEAAGMKTQHVRNVTNVDDKTIRGSMEAGQSLEEFTEYWTRLLHADCESLAILPPHQEPSAIAHVPEQIELIGQLMEKGLAYQSENGSIYYRISAFEEYGKLCHLNKDDVRHNADRRLNTSDEYDKENASDFALWKIWREEDGDNAWDSPWGRGRPGWHIECSAMSMKYLGESFDMHSGGVDLIFPHHENEIAQSEGATGKTFARHWFHVAHLKVEGEKMSKSIGNLYTVDDVESWGFEPNDLRYALLAGHYRQPLNFTKDSLNACRSARRRLGQFAELLPVEVDSDSGFFLFEPVLDALLDDLNTPKALGLLHSITQEASSDLKTGKLSSEEMASLATGFHNVLKAFGLDLPQSEAESQEVPETIKALAEQRAAARVGKDWAEADRLRDELGQAGWEMRDQADGYELTKL
ncbi:MAG: cysteine--tRNA ligase [Opitutae bacterium]|nr:cysteine--tRNA ligase [Opitutae bacterium]|tara:strand:- start:6914 stop:8314 length:1401 start_codon:yes stop_codon:yes gene_type:complete